MYSRIRNYDKETNTWTVKYRWWNKDKVPQIANSCLELIEQIEKEYNIIESDMFEKLNNG